MPSIFLISAYILLFYSSIHLLWFLIFLLVYTLLLLPLFLYMKSPGGKRLATAVGGFLSRRFAVFLWAIPITLLEAFLAHDARHLVELAGAVPDER